MCIHRGGALLGGGQGQEVLCPGNSAPLDGAAMPGLLAVLLVVFVHFMAEVQNHPGSTGLLQTLNS